jgi:hypothetical protein
LLAYDLEILDFAGETYFVPFIFERDLSLFDMSRRIAAFELDCRSVEKLFWLLLSSD